jgi:nucleotide-binding universal stress UspA family protein
MLRSILVHLDNTARDAARTEVALNLARAHGARLTGLYVMDVPQSAKDGEEGDATWAAQAAARAERTFRERTDGATVPIAWKTALGDVPDVVVRLARRVDLLVIGQGSRQEAKTGACPAARIALATGRPLIVVPEQGEFPVIGHRVLVAWSDSREAARALEDALPILSAADRTVVLLVNPAEGPRMFDGATDLSEQLSSHGIKAVILRAFANRIDIGDAILTRARETGADLVVMGARGAISDAQPMVGQTTRHVLANTTVPLLISS